jgi:hypothetical protein
VAVELMKEDVCKVTLSLESKRGASLDCLGPVYLSKFHLPLARVSPFFSESRLASLSST